MKTKIHSTRNAAAQLDEESERTVFLEVQIQNTSPEPLHLDQPSLNPAEHQEVDDVSNLPGGQIQPGDLLQCLYVVKSQASHYHKLIEKAKHSNGVIPLGRLDIKWRNRMGDQGHLSTSQLLRRVPQHLLPPAPSPRPPIHQNAISLAPQQTPEKGGQARNRDLLPMQSPQLDSGTALSPGASPRMQQHEFPRHHIQSKDLTAALHVLPMVAKCERVGEPFAVKFKLSLNSLLRDTEEKQSSQTRRILKLAVQHVDHTNIPAVNTNTPAPPAADLPMVPHLHPDAAPLQSARTSIDTEKPLPSTLALEGYQAPLDNPTIHLPPPFALLQDNPFFYPPSSSSMPSSTKPDPQCAYYGNTLKWLEPILLSHGPAVRKSKEASSYETSTLNDTETLISTDSSSTTDSLPLDEMMRIKSAEWTQHTEVEFELQYLAYSTGIFKLGGVRILLLEDKWCEENGEEDYRPGLMPCTLLEHNVVAEVRVGS